MKTEKRITESRIDRPCEGRVTKSNKAKRIAAEIIAKRYGEILTLRAELQRAQRRRNPE